MTSAFRLRFSETLSAFRARGGAIGESLKTFGGDIMAPFAIAATGITTALGKIRTTDYFELAEHGMDKIRKPFDVYEKTLQEANYHARPRTLWSLIRGKKRDLPETAQLEVGEKMVDTSRTIGKRFMWAAIFAALSMKMLVVLAVGLAFTGIGMFALGYHRAKKDRLDVITEINMAGQKVQGTRADLCRLHMAQCKIMNLASTFKQASLESTADTISNAMKAVEEERRRVKILEQGPYGALTDVYDFSRPLISLVNKDERDAAARAEQERALQAERAAAEIRAKDEKDFPHAGDFGTLRDSWRAKKGREEQILDQLVALQKSLPPRLKRKFEAELRKAA